MFRTRGAGKQDNWDLWINASVFAYNTTVNSSTGVTPHYATFGQEEMLPVDWVFPTPSVEKRTMYQWIAPALAYIKPVYYPGEEKLVSLDMLKLYHGEDVICQDPEDIDPDRWLGEGELTELLEAPLGEA